MKETKFQEVRDYLKQQILENRYPDFKLPNERALSDELQVSRSTIRKAISLLSDEGLVFKKERSGIFINQLTQQNYQNFKTQRKGPSGLTNSFSDTDKKITTKLIHFDVIKAPEIVRQSLLLNEDDFVYFIKRVREIDGQPVILEHDYIPVFIAPRLSKSAAENSLVNYAKKELGIIPVNSYLFISSEPSSEEDRTYLALKQNEPVSVLKEIVFSEKGSPFLFSVARNHYQYFTYQTNESLY